ncbi:MAG: FecR domain-containing protein [Thermoanaerobaculia bacterium]
MNENDLLDRALAAVDAELPDAAVTAAAMHRVHARLAAESAAVAEAGAPPADRIRGCADFQALIPAYLADALTPSRRLLLEDHTRECLPCRKALAAARRGTESGAAIAPAAAVPARAPWVRWALAASLAGLALVAGGRMLWNRGLFAPAVSGRVVAIQGEILALDGARAESLAAGSALAAGRTVRTGAGSTAVVELADGTRIEIAERSELSLARRADGAAIELARGNVIVAAAKQHGHLYVETGDCKVAVVGTIFAVNHGAKGSRVSVIEGEVRIERGPQLAVLRPGEQFATSNRLARVSVASEVAWSRNAEDYAQRLAALAEVGHALDAALAAPGDRSSTRLLDLAPASTAVYVALPNVAESLAGAWQAIESRLATDSRLAAGWRDAMGGDGEAAMAKAIDELREIGSRLGPEVVVAVGLDAAGRLAEPVLLAEVPRPNEFPSFLAAENARLAAAGPGAPVLELVADPHAVAGGDDHRLRVWLSGDLLVASPATARIAEIADALAAGARPFAGSPFHQRLASVYRQGAGWLVGADLQRLLADSANGGRHDADLDRLGLDSASGLILESESIDGATENRADLSFAGGRHGMAAWLAAPAPMGALEFVSPDAQAAAGMLLEDPSTMLADLLAIASDHGHGDDDRAEVVAIANELAGALGGEVVFALDGPMLPEPSWKLVLEVRDAARLDTALADLVERWNRDAAADGRPAIALSQEDVGGELYHRLATADGRIDLDFAVVDGYLVAGPNRGLVAQAIATRQAGVTLVSSDRFRSLLPTDGESNFSAFAYQNLASGLGTIGEWLAGNAARIAPEVRSQIESALGKSGPTLALVYGGPDRITFVARGGSGPFGASFESLFALEGLLANARAGAAPAPEGHAGAPGAARGGETARRSLRS